MILQNFSEVNINQLRQSQWFLNERRPAPFTGGHRRRRSSKPSILRSEDLKKTTSSANAIPQDPIEVVTWGGRLPSTRRLALSAASATFIALGGNFFGITSFLLSLDKGQLARSSRLDVLVPVLGFKRYVDYADMFEFQYPAQWLADQTVARRAAQRAERERSLDPPSLGQQRKAVDPYQEVAEPSAAFGPPGSTGEKNVSIIAAPIMPGFILESLGSAESAAKRFLTTIAPEGSERSATFLGAQERRSPEGLLYYQMEYIIQGPTFRRHNISTYCSRNGKLYTFNVQCPEIEWESEELQLRKSASSFKLT
ncbi:hypothetical protein CEUSTIGMA_g4177.t1 [Chlamydomonas eustigma]|uniref:PsbP C-terminal domain-containing protein n=1 Tax=Chlamydomonas eustigma TaxID=1157962 RepID=A0A250X1W2_9CHLO|nr:hypothetical protein CEUSTIGMA_g4177.t1 [Chlamydomonas eustigma]|eukprot:GAX76730.1 hypothetical protein CEUSTIGMA_g4177.t1 [Chlamydomonas eustigma]